MLRPRATGIQGRPTRSLSLPETPQHPRSSHLSSSSRNTSREVRGCQNPITMSGQDRARPGFPTPPGLTPRAGVDGPALRGSWPPALPQQPHHGQPVLGSQRSLLVALTARRSGGCCPHGPASSSSSTLGIPGAAGSGGGTGWG